jgi:hypothetical protein
MVFSFEIMGLGKISFFGKIILHLRREINPAFHWVECPSPG